MRGIGIGLRRAVRLAGGGGASYDADAVTLFAAMSSQPDATRKALVNTTILALKAAGVWTLLDECWFMAAHDSQAALLGWKRYKNLTAVNAPTFTADQGYAGNGTTSYLSTQFTPSTNGVQYTLNDASFGVYSRTNAASAGCDMGGGASGSDDRCSINSRITAVGYRSDINMDGSTFADVANSDSRGLFAARRAASGTMTGWKNGSQVATASVTSSALPSAALFIGVFNAAGTPVAFSTRQYAAGFVGASLSAQQQADLFTITEAYLDAIGAGVI